MPDRFGGLAEEWRMRIEDKGFDDSCGSGLCKTRVR